MLHEEPCPMRARGPGTVPAELPGNRRLQVMGPRESLSHEGMRLKSSRVKGRQASLRGLGEVSSWGSHRKGGPCGG